MKNYFFIISFLYILVSCTKEDIGSNEISDVTVKFKFSNSWTNVDGNSTNYVPRSEFLPDLILKILDDNNNIVKDILINEKANGNYVSFNIQLEYGKYSFVIDDKLDEKSIDISDKILVRDKSVNQTIETEVQTINLVLEPSVWLLEVNAGDILPENRIVFMDTLRPTDCNSFIDGEKYRIGNVYYFFMNNESESKINYYLWMKGTKAGTNTCGEYHPIVAYPPNKYPPQKHIILP